MVRICPVCGSHSISRFREGLAREADGDMYFIDNYLDHYLECVYCGHSVYARNWEEAEKLWNTEEPSQWGLNY